MTILTFNVMILLSLSLLHTHTHTHFLSLPLSLSPPPPFPLSEVKLSRTIKSSTLSHQVPSEKDYFQVTDELSKENSHFALSDALLAVIEQVSEPIIHGLYSGMYMYLGQTESPQRRLIWVDCGDLFL